MASRRENIYNGKDKGETEIFYYFCAVMISKNKAKWIRSLAQKKMRQEEKVFVAEGGKIVGELLESGIECLFIAATSEWLESRNMPKANDIAVVTAEELRGISMQQHPQDVLGVFRQFENEPCKPTPDELIIALDGVQDPGNMGTIIRIADWFGVGTILCNEGTVDVYNPKVVQATMGSIARVGVEYVDLAATLSGISSDIPIYGTLLDGENIYNQQLTCGGIIVMGNEAAGISANIRPLIRQKLFIPSFPHGIGFDTAESLNVGVATAITCAEFRRRLYK